MTATRPETRPNRSARTLGSTLTSATLLAVAAGTLVYAAFEYLTGHPASLAEFTTHHLVPALLIGVTVCATLAWLLHSKLITPTRTIFAHLYRIGSGQLTPLSLDTDVSEIRTVVEGVNLLVARLKGTPGDGALGKAIDSLVKLRSDLETATSNAGETADTYVPVMRDLRKLEGDLLSVMQAAKPNA